MPAETQSLHGRTVAGLATHGFEQSELFEPVKALRDAGATVHIVSPENGSIRAWNHTDWGEDIQVDRTIGEANAHTDDYDALLLPGGVLNPDKLRMREDATRFCRSFFHEGKPVSAICHGAQTLIDCDVVNGRTMTSYPAIKNDLKNAGARWEDREVVTDNGLTTSRTPDDLPAFISATIEQIAEGVKPASRTT